MKYSHLIFIFAVLSALGCNQDNDSQEETNSTKDWKLVYRNDKNGKAVFGDKEELISIARKGHPLKIGWASRRRNDTTKSVEHIINAQFITIANGSELFAQVQPFLAQRPDLTSDTLSMTLIPVKSNWVLGTNGTISSINIDLGKDSIRTSPPKPFRYSLSWFARTSKVIHKESPLWSQN